MPRRPSSRPSVPAALVLGWVLVAGSQLVTGAPATSAVAPGAAADLRGAPAQKRSVMFVGNNWAGTATVVDADSLDVLRRGIDLVPDREEELAAIRADPERLAYYLAVQQGPGEGHDQLVDDMFTTRNGRYLAVSRPSLADVVWIDLANPDTWRLTRNDVGTLSDELPQFQGKDISYESVRHGAKIKVVIRCDSPEAWSVLWQEPGDTTWARAGELLTHAGGYVAESRTDRLKGRNWRELADLLIAG